MCCCGKPTVNGEPNAYSWDGKRFMTNQPNPPDLADGDTLLYDLPGRCGGMDCHSHHLRLVQASMRSTYLLVRHGGGDERHEIWRLPVDLLASMDDNQRYWLLYSIYSAMKDARKEATERESMKWRQAAAEKRIKTRKVRGQDACKVWIEDRQPVPA